MKIVVCLKQVPASGTITLDADGGLALASQAGLMLNPFDAYALEAALRVKQATGGTITALTIGAKEASAVLREALTLGADQALHVMGSTRDLTSLQVAYILAAAVKTLEGVALVFTGQESTVTNSGAVAPMLAEFLGFPHIVGARSVEVGATGIKVERSREKILETLGAEFPVLVTVSREVGEPRRPTVKEVLAARKVTIPIVDLSDLGLPAAALAQLGWVTTRGWELVPGRSSGEILQGSIEEQSQALCQKLIADGILSERRDV